MNWILDNRRSLFAAAALSAAAILCGGGILNPNSLVSALISVALLAG